MGHWGRARTSDQPDHREEQVWSSRIFPGKFNLEVASFCLSFLLQSCLEFRSAMQTRNAGYPVLNRSSWGRRQRLWKDKPCRCVQAAQVFWPEQHWCSLQWQLKVSETSLVHQTRAIDGPPSRSLCSGNGAMKGETQGSFPSKLTIQRLTAYAGRTFSDNTVELQPPLKCTEMVRTNSEDFSVREKCHC